MKCRKNAIRLLKRLLETNETSEREYLCTADHARKLWFRNFFRRLGLQKRTFCTRIKNEIEVLENEILLLGGKVERSESSSSGEPIQLPAFRFEKDELLRKCYFREKISCRLYSDVLSQVSIPSVRDMLLFQRHAVRINISEIDAMGLHIYEETGQDEFTEDESQFKRGVNS